MNDQSQKKSGASSCFLFGCIGLLVLGALTGGGGYFAMKKGMSAAADAIYERVSADMESMDLDPAEKEEADALLLRLRDGVTSGEIGIMDAAKLMEAMEDSELLAYGGLLSAKSMINANEDLTPEEKDVGMLQMSRYADGMAKNRFSEADLNEVLGAIGETGADGGVKINDKPTTEEIRDMIGLAKAKADEAGLGEEGLQIDFVGELQTLVDKVLGPQ